MASVNNIMKLFGMSGIAESAPIKRNTTKVKKYNAERFMEAYAFIKADEYKAQAEAAQVRNYVLTAKARGEADSEIVNKVKKAGTDLWRKVKELLGKLMIVIEEFFAKLFDKTKPLAKMQSTLEKQYNRLERMVKEKYNLDETVKVEVPYFGNSTTNLDFDASADNTAALLNILERDAKTDDEHNLSLKHNLAWFAMIKSTLTSKGDKALYRTLKSKAKSIIDGGSVTAAIATPDDQKHPLSANILQFINTGLAISASEVSLKEEQRKLARAKQWVKYNTMTITSNKDLGAIANVAKNAIIEVDGAKRAITRIVSYSKEIKMAINKIKNAPTSVTGSLKADQLQVIRKICAETNKAVNIERKIANTKASVILLSASDLTKAITKVMAKVEDEREDDDELIRGARSVR